MKVSHAVLPILIILMSACSGSVAGGDEDAGTDAVTEDAGQDAGEEDAGQDAGEDGGLDAGEDAGGEDAGEDAGQDAGEEDAGGDPGPERCPPLTGDPALPACPPTGWTSYGADSLLLLDEPSMASAGDDFILELSASGALIQTVLSTDEGVQGASDIALDPMTGHLFYSVSHWSLQIFEVRELSADGAVLNTLSMPEAEGGNIALAFDADGTLYAAYGSHI